MNLVRIPSMRRCIVIVVIRNNDLLLIIESFCKTILSRNFNTACVNINHILVINQIHENILHIHHQISMGVLNSYIMHNKTDILLHMKKSGLQAQF